VIRGCGGKLYDPRFHARMRGKGPFAAQIADLAAQHRLVSALRGQDLFA
jgi:hypothetical protein